MRMAASGQEVRQMTSAHKEIARSLLVALGWGAGVGLGLLLAHAAAPGVIAWIYEGHHVPRLVRGIIAGQSVHPVGHYVGHFRDYLLRFAPLLVSVAFSLGLFARRNRHPEWFSRFGWLAPLLVYLAHSLLYAGWIVDDAAISFAYARNAAAGHGLVAYPGTAPVEGFSNPLWTLLLVPFYAARLFHFYVTPKLIGFVLVAATFRSLSGLLARFAPRPAVATFLGLMLLGLNTPFVVWTASGLENPLYAFLVVYLCGAIAATLSAAEGAAPPRRYLWLGLCAGLLALVRPDAVLFAFALPAIMVLLRLRGQPMRWRRLGPYVLGAGASFGAYFAFRLAYYRDVAPNTFYAKSGEAHYVMRVFDGTALMQVVDLLRATGGWLAVALLAFAALHWIRRYWAGAPSAPAALSAFVFLGIALAIFGLLPKDWMWEYRFATPFFPLFYGAVAALLVDFAQGQNGTGGGRWRSETALAVGIGALVLAQAAFFMKRSYDFCIRPVQSTELFLNTHVKKVNDYARRLGLTEASVLFTDFGAPMLYSELRPIDLGGLCDRTIARTLYYRQDRPAFYDYIFEDARPTVISVYRAGSYLARFDEDPRFRRDYLPLHEFEDPWVTHFLGRPAFSGDYVRKDAVADKDERVRELQQTWPYRNP